MSDEELSAHFISWVDSHQGNLAFPIAYDTVSSGEIEFTLDNARITFNFLDCEIQCNPSAPSKVKSWISWASEALLDRAEGILLGSISLSEILDIIIPQYAKYQHQEDEEDEDFFDSEEEDDYAELMEAHEKVKKEAEEERKRKVPDDDVEAPPEVTQRISQLEQQFAGQGSVQSNKRILQEYKYLVCSKECTGITVDFAGGDNIYIWNVWLDMNKFEVSKELKQDFQQYAKQHGRPMSLDFEVRFDSNFPYSPPFLRIIRPRFAFHTGHVTVGGSICMQSITNSGWIPVRTVESVFIEILFNMGEGNARLDPRNAHIDYSIEEAREAFNRVARQHNWM